MRSCHPGAPVGVTDSDENARALAATLDEAGHAVVAARPGVDRQVGAVQ